MSTKTISVDVPDDIFLALDETETELKGRIKLLLAIQLYQQEKLTIGMAAQFSGHSRLDFETILSKAEIPISNLAEEDVLGDIEKLRC